MVLGGGLAGLSTLWHLQKAGYDNSFLFERESRVGGLARSEVVQGFTFDYTGHLLHFQNPAVRQLVADLLGENLHYLDRDSWILSKGVCTRYPFQSNLYGLPPDVIDECISGYIAARQGNSPQAESSRFSSDYSSFQEWIERTLGAGIARHFMVPYNEKLWTVRLQDLTCEWMGRFVPSTSLQQILEGARQDQKQSSGYNARFGYPLQGGIEALPRAFHCGLKSVFVRSEVVQVDLKSKVVRLDNGEEIQFENLVSTLPLPELIRILPETPATVNSAASRLRFNSVYNVNLGVGRKLSKKHWIYVPEPDFLFYRIGFPDNFSPYQAPERCGSVYTEIAYSQWKPLDKAQALERVKHDLIRTGILQKEDPILAECCLDIPCAYVIYDHQYRPSVDLILQFLYEQGIWSIGRYGEWKYSGMEEAIWQGKQVADQILRCTR